MPSRIARKKYITEADLVRAGLARPREHRPITDPAPSTRRIVSRETLVIVCSPDTVATARAELAKRFPQRAAVIAGLPIIIDERRKAGSIAFGGLRDAS